MGVNVIRPRRLSAREVLSVRLEPELREALDHEAARRGLTRSDLIRQALTASVDQDVLREAAAREQGGHQARNESRRGPARNRTSSLAERRGGCFAATTV
jgi:predicted transcriptional regulator